MKTSNEIIVIKLINHQIKDILCLVRMFLRSEFGQSLFFQFILLANYQFRKGDTSLIKVIFESLLESFFVFQ